MNEQTPINSDRIEEFLADKGKITINNILYDESVHMNIIESNKPQGKLDKIFYFAQNTGKLLSIATRVATITSPVWIPRIAPVIKERIGQKVVNRIESKNLTHKYRETIKLESASGKYELFAECKNKHPLTDYLIFKYDTDFSIGLVHNFDKKHLFTDKFSPYLKREDVVLYYKESVEEKDTIKTIVYKIQKGVKPVILTIMVHAFNMETSIKEIPDNKVEIIQ